MNPLPSTCDGGVDSIFPNAFDPTVKLNIDHQYALKLQSALQEGNQDEEKLGDADSLLGEDAVKRLMVSSIQERSHKELL